MATSRLKLYNGALLLCGESRLATLSDNVEARYLLDEVYNDGGIGFCLEQAQWHFAMRSSQFDYNASLTPAWGYSKAFDKPTDWIATSGVFSDEYMRSPLLDYADEAEFWYSDHQTMYVKYVSNHADFGGDMSKWPDTFVEYVKAYFAGRICHRVPGSDEKRDFLLGPTGHEHRGHVNRVLITAKNKAAMTQPTTFPKRGTWVQSRRAGTGRSYRDGGSFNTLLG